MTEESGKDKNNEWHKDWIEGKEMKAWKKERKRKKERKDKVSEWVSK